MRTSFANVSAPNLARLLAIVVALACVGCAPKHAMPTPEGFVRYEKRRELALITADGIRVKSREVRNYPAADLPFWIDAMKRHLVARGYAIQAERCFQTAQGLSGCTVEFLLPHGAEDWLLSETLFVVGERLALVEAAGPFDRFGKVKAALSRSLQSFDPGQ